LLATKKIEKQTMIFFIVVLFFTQQLYSATPQRRPLPILTMPTSDDYVLKRIKAGPVACRRQYNCTETVSTMFELFFPNFVEIMQPLERYHNTRIPSKRFFEKKEDGHYTFPGVEKIFEQPLSPEHLFIAVHIEEELHFFIIEKKYDGKNLWWRIYQSLLWGFNLEEWLGLTPWPTNLNPKVKGLFDDFYAAYGKSKRLNVLELEAFLKAMVTFYENLESSQLTRNREEISVYVYRDRAEDLRAAIIDGNVKTTKSILENVRVSPGKISISPDFVHLAETSLHTTEREIKNLEDIITLLEK
jgi:hypothetical protein